MSLYVSIKLTLSLRMGASECLRAGRGTAAASTIDESRDALGNASEGPAVDGPGLATAVSGAAPAAATDAALLGSTCMASEAPPATHGATRGKLLLSDASMQECSAEAPRECTGGAVQVVNAETSVCVSAIPPAGPKGAAGGESTTCAAAVVSA